MTTTPRDRDTWILALYEADCFTHEDICSLTLWALCQFDFHNDVTNHERSDAHKRAADALRKAEVHGWLKIVSRTNSIDYELILPFHPKHLPPAENYTIDGEFAS